MQDQTEVAAWIKARRREFASGPPPAKFLVSQAMHDNLREYQNELNAMLGCEAFDHTAPLAFWGVPVVAEE